MVAEADGKLAKSVLRAMSIIETLGIAQDGLRLTELSKILQLPHPTVYRLLKTLIHAKFVEQDQATSKYYVSTKILQMQAHIGQRFGLIDQAGPILAELVERTKESAHLAILNDIDIVYLLTRRHPKSLNIYSPPGRTLPAYHTALGKTLLAHLTPTEAAERVERIEFVRLTPNTIVDRDQFLAHLEEIRQEGYACDNGEGDLGLFCLAAPVYNEEGLVQAAISVSGSSSHLGLNSVPSLAPIVQEAAQELSRQLRYWTL